MSNTQLIIELMSMHRQLETMDKTLVDLFNKGNPCHLDEDPLFQPTHSAICKYWEPRKLHEGFLMNYNCGHPDADCDWGDADHCSIMSCLDEELATQPAGQLVKTHSAIHPITMKVLDLFNNHNGKCIYHRPRSQVCSKCDEYCNAANCPL
jgi:hypothetical protein